ncbi:hypothetical protein [Streptomyces coffeae]|uniref:Helix-turn-helix domain-containing protein n=1 Tax=Streptomyces coffeae TaxID=621382 RepID=A0ABS1NK06_9ACTN|nr:hypothetical protein [Streptomyces coffeae]MBL1100106.1 hypothetical protein [Streptomyces coffeae]
MKIRADIAELLHAGHRDNAIAKQLGACPKTIARARAALGLPQNPPGRPVYNTLEAAWHAHTEPADSGHLLWTGTVNSGVPVIRYKGQRHSAYLIAYRIGHSRDPKGRCRPDCGRPGCVAPSHVDDGPGRARTRALLAAIFGEESAS